MTEPGSSTPSFDMVAAALRADSADVAAYARVLSETLGDTLPPGSVTVERERSMADRMRGRPGEVRKITVRLGEQVMTLGMSHGRPTAVICREGRRVALSPQPAPSRHRQLRTGERARRGTGPCNIQGYSRVRANHPQSPRGEPEVTLAYER